MWQVPAVAHVMASSSAQRRIAGGRCSSRLGCTSYATFVRRAGAPHAPHASTWTEAVVRASATQVACAIKACAPGWLPSRPQARAVVMQRRRAHPRLVMGSRPPSAVASTVATRPAAARVRHRREQPRLALVVAARREPFQSRWHHHRAAGWPLERRTRQRVARALLLLLAAAAAAAASAAALVNLRLVRWMLLRSRRC